MAHPGWPGRHSGNRHRVWMLRPLRCSRTASGPDSGVYRHAASRSRGATVSLGIGRGEPSLLDYGRTSPDALDASGPDPLDTEAIGRWRRSPFYRMLQTGDSVFRRRLSVATEEDFSPLPDLLAAGMTDYVAIITRF